MFIVQVCGVIRVTQHNAAELKLKSQIHILCFECFYGMRLCCIN